jgi:hypothetical protein
MLACKARRNSRAKVREIQGFRLYKLSCADIYASELSPASVRVDSRTGLSRVEGDRVMQGVRDQLARRGSEQFNR